MRPKPKQICQGELCRTRLRFSSLTSLMALVGFCAGIVALPIIMLTQADKLFEDTSWFGAFLFTFVGAPIVGAANGVLYGVLGYPIYRWITRRFDVHTYSGEFAILSNDGDKEI
jgi:hypothetical protein